MSGTTIPTVVTAAGLQPQPVADLRAQIVAIATGLRPGLTTDLPGSLVEDLTSTAVAGVSVMDQARVDLVNSLSPYGANEFLLNQLGQIYGVERGASTNTSVNVIFSGTPGYAIAQGFLVTDGTHLFAVQSGSVISGSGVSGPTFCLATTSGSFPVPAGTVNRLSTSAPSAVGLTVTNPSDGVPGLVDGQTITDYRAAVLLAGRAASTGMPSYVKSQVSKVDGVQPRLISARLDIPTSKWEVIVGGGDPYQVANAIFLSISSPENLVGSTIRVVGITQAVAGVVTTDLNHHYTTGQVVTITSVVGMTGVNGVPYTVTVTGSKTFTIGNTSGFGAYVSGGVCSPNSRNVVISINDYPDTYPIPIVIPPQQSVSISLTWNTNSPNFVSPTAMAQLGAPALVDYVNSIVVGSPMNEFELQNAFQLAVASILSPTVLTRMVFSIVIDGTVVAPLAGTGIVQGDPESYFFTTLAQISIVQG